MHNGIAAAIVIGIVFLGIIGIIREITEYMLKQKLINSGHTAPNTLKILSPPVDNRFTALKWGLISFFGGLGLVTLEFINYSRESPFPYGVELVFISAGFLVYYFSTRREISKSQQVEV